MTDKLYLITEAQRDNYLQIMRNNMQDPDAYHAIAELQSLPMVASEPVSQEKLLGAIGRAWCHQENTHKVLDEAVSFAVCKEIQALNLYTSPQATVYPKLTPHELTALNRFLETCEDGEGYDVPKSMMQRLAQIGVVRHLSRGIYSITEFGRLAVEI